jgi:glycosyltransferase involved in cell wall biosynthesis
MKILIVTQYFWPENFRINDLAIGLQERGHHVEIFTGKPNYPIGKFYKGYSFFGKRTEIWNGIKIHRVPMFPRGSANALRLFLNYLSFAAFGLCRALILKGNFDRILVYEPSPITVGIPAILIKHRKKASIFFWVQDLWPHSISAAGGINNRTILYLFDKLTKWIYKKSDKILIQSEGFREIIRHQCGSNDKIVYYPNSVESLFQINGTKNEIAKILPQGFKVMFAGNIGESQDFDTIVKAAMDLKNINPDIKWIILGDGRKRLYVENKIHQLGLENQFFLLGSFPIERMPDFYACSDCLLVSLKRDFIFSLTIPSKIQSYLACGKPIVASLNGEGARVIKEARAGAVGEAEDAKSLASNVLSLYNLNEEQRQNLGKNARMYFEANFERELLIDKLLQIFQSHD